MREQKCHIFYAFQMAKYKSNSPGTCLQGDNKRKKKHTVNYSE